MKMAKEKEAVSPLVEHHQATAKEQISFWQLARFGMR